MTSGASKTPLSMRQQLALIRAMEEHETTTHEDCQDVEKEPNQQHDAHLKKRSTSTPSSGHRVGLRTTTTTPAEDRLARRLQRINAKGESQLHRAAIRGATRACVALLRLGADPNALDHAHWTPLHEASNHGHLGVAKALVTFGAEVNKRGGINELETPLHDAAKNGHLDLAVFLVNKGADLKAKKSNGDTPLDLAEKYSDNPKLVKFLREAEARGDSINNDNELGQEELIHEDVVSSEHEEEDFLHFLGLQSSPGLEVALAKMESRVQSESSEKASSRPSHKSSSKKRAPRDKWIVSSPLKDCNKLERHHHHHNCSDDDGRPKRKVAKTRLTYSEDTCKKRNHSSDGDRDGKSGSNIVLKRLGNDENSEQPHLKLRLNVRDTVATERASNRTLCTQKQPNKRDKDWRRVERGSKNLFKMERIVYPKISTSLISTTQASVSKEVHPTSNFQKTDVDRLHPTKCDSLVCENELKMKEPHEVKPEVTEDKNQAEPDQDMEKNNVHHAPEQGFDGVRLNSQRSQFREESIGQSCPDNFQPEAKPKILLDKAEVPLVDHPFGVKEADMNGQTSPEVIKGSEVSEAVDELSQNKAENLQKTENTKDLKYVHKKLRAKATPSSSTFTTLAFPRTNSSISSISMSSVEANTTLSLSSDIERRVRLNQITWDRKRSLFAVRPKPPQGFDDYLMNRKTYLLQSSKYRKPPTLPPSSLCNDLKRLFRDQEEERLELRERQQVEREKLILSAEQEIVRIHSRAASALANQTDNLSFCTLLRMDNTFKLEPLKEETSKDSSRSRYNGRVFISWLQDSDDKWERIKQSTLLRHMNEAEALHAVQTMNWEFRVDELKASGHVLANEEWQSSTKVHVAMVEVADHFESSSNL